MKTCLFLCHYFFLFISTINYTLNLEIVFSSSHPFFVVVLSLSSITLSLYLFFICLSFLILFNFSSLCLITYLYLPILWHFHTRGMILDPTPHAHHQQQFPSKSISKLPMSVSMVISRFFTIPPFFFLYSLPFFFFFFSVNLILFTISKRVFCPLSQVGLNEKVSKKMMIMIKKKLPSVLTCIFVCQYMKKKKIKYFPTKKKKEVKHIYVTTQPGKRRMIPCARNTQTYTTVCVQFPYEFPIAKNLLACIKIKCRSLVTHVLLLYIHLKKKKYNLRRLWYFI